MNKGIMDCNIDGVPFGEIMNQAVKLKTHQAKPDRWIWDAWPKFKQNTMFGKEEIQAARDHKEFEDRLKAAYELKAIADTMFRDQRYLDAAYKYENSTAVFRWLTNQNPDWKKKGILDAEIDEHEYEPKNEYERSKVNGFLVACYLNIARLYHKRKDTLTAIQACTYALEIDDQCDKALLLRAQVRIAPKSAGATEQEQSLKDASNAQKVLQYKLNNLSSQIESIKQKKKKGGGRDDDDDDGEGGGGGGDKYEGIDRTEAKLLELGEDGAFDLDAVANQNDNRQDDITKEKTDTTKEKDEEEQGEELKLLNEKKEISKRFREVVKYVKTLKDEKVKQQKLDKEWGGVFTKGVIYEASSSSAASQASCDSKGNTPATPEESMLNQVTDAQRLLQMYEQNNRHDDADRIRKDVETAKQNFSKFQKQKTEQSSKPQTTQADFFNPTEDMKKDAKERGLDLDDPMVLDMLQKLQKSHESGVEVSDESIDNAFSSEKLKSIEKLREEVTPLIKEMRSKEIRDALKLMNRPYQHEDGSRMSHDVLVENMIQLVLLKAENGETLPNLSQLQKNNNTSFISKFLSSASLFFSYFNLIKNDNDEEEEGDDGDGKGTAAKLEQIEKDKQTRTFRITFALASIFFIFRLWYSGQFGIFLELYQNGDFNQINDSDSMNEGGFFDGDDEEIDYEFLSEF